MEQTEYYSKPRISGAVAPLFWDKTETDYNETINLARGCGYWIESHLDIDGPDAEDSKNTRDTVNSLTNGVYAAKATMHDEAWFRFTRGLARDITIDLGCISAVDGVRIGLLYEKEVAVYTPSHIDIFVSEDGAGWMPVHRGAGYYNGSDSDIIRKTDSFKNTYKARFIKIQFVVSPHVYIDEIEVLGRKNIAGALDVVPEDIKTSFVDKFASPDEFGGIRDVLLSYFNADEGGPGITKEEYLPHVGYIKDGKIKDVMFDSFMYLPYVSFLYSGYKKRELKKADWQRYMDAQFKQDVNINALEASVQEVKDALGLENYKVKIYFSLFFPVTTVTDFGEVEGRSLDFSKKEDRYLALKWMVDEQLRQFNEKKYKNIELAGYYWFTEEIGFSDEDLADILNDITGYIRELGYYTTWIPYYQASGFNLWKTVGFDLACYQPNYAFNDSIPVSRLYNAMKEAKRFGMCLEIEVGKTSENDVDRLKNYLYAAAVTGVMTDSIHMYYQGRVPGVFYDVYKSEDPYMNSMYDDLYKFMKHTFETDPAGPEPAGFKCTQGMTLSGNIPGNPVKAIKNIIIVKEPEHGSLEVQKDGSFVYNPEKDFSGTDIFEAAYDYSYIISKSAVIKIEVV